MKTIVVGVDGSACAHAALEFAGEEAALRGAHLRIVCAWEIPPIVDPSGVYAGVYPQDTLQGFQDKARTIMDEALALMARLQPSIRCEERIIEGQPADVILTEAHDAALIVVGSRGRGGFARLLLGSTSQQVVHHAQCPVVVVRGPAC